MAPRKLDLEITLSGLTDAQQDGEIFVAVKVEETLNKFTEVGRTEVAKVSNELTFETHVTVSYYFERLQNVQFCILDNAQSEDNNMLGSAVANIGKMVAENTTILPLEDTAVLEVKCEEIPESSNVAFEMRAEGLDKKDLFGKSDPYVCIYRQEDENKWKIAYKTEYIQNTLHPQWKPFTVDYHRLCKGNPKAPLKISCYDHDASRSDLIGEFVVTLSDIIDNDAPSTHLLINPKKKAKKKGYTKSGKLIVTKCKEIKHHSFLKYVAGGCEIKFTCGVDFTASNGDSRQSTSLHYCGGMQPNDYVKAIYAIGSVIEKYAGDVNFPAYGFGAKILPDNKISHDFPLNLDFDNPGCNGISGVVEAYTGAIGKVKLWGPTNVAPIIEMVATLARNAHNYPERQQYYVLLILTDGVVTDMEDTLQAIVDNSDLPMSVIIVGIGNADFTGMKVLDVNEKGKLKGPNGNSTERSIVQFIPFRNFKLASPSAFAASVLVNIPTQLEAYFKMHKIAPQTRQLPVRKPSSPTPRTSESENIPSQEEVEKVVQEDETNVNKAFEEDVEIVQTNIQSTTQEVDCNA